MKIIIVGAGQVGFHIASRLAYENKDVVMMIFMMLAGMGVDMITSLSVVAASIGNIGPVGNYAEIRLWENGF